MTDDAVIRVERLTRRYGRRLAVDALDLTVPPGTIYGFLGPNGAGKTTTIRALLGFLRPTSGRTLIHGHDSWRDGLAARARLGYLVESGALYADMSGSAQLDFAARLSQGAPVLQDRILDALELDRDVLSRRLGTYSKGMRQKLALTAAFQTDPDVLILDEPTDGLDPLVQRRFEDLLRERVAAGRTILMSSHDLAEVERICGHVAIIRDGRLVADQPVDELIRRRLRVAEIRSPASLGAGLATVPGVRVTGSDGGRHRITIEGDLQPLLAFLGQHPVEDLIISPPRLEDVFFGFYGDTSGREDPR
ncbi:MAG TPA: ABC transporter ATP-binding protein [Thermomicrobiales bacterium]|jgi:ABC-2 type transport system ATP-binding protein|nr:ABC transporter ATP-binding protein [Thermomicrobiales bacterium]